MGSLEEVVFPWLLYYEYEIGPECITEETVPKGLNYSSQGDCGMFQQTLSCGWMLHIHVRVIILAVH